ncbi:MAG: thioredoxin domain-containing protein [Candidatus Paceibacterota bacterium]|jgi:protein-disulfide isomerase
MQEEKKNLSIPGAIVIAGLLIAGGIYLSSSNFGMKTNETKTSSVLVKAIDKDDHILGNPDAPIVIVEYGDTECPPCKMFQSTMQTVMSAYGKDGKVAWVFRHSPLESLHSKASKEAEATECANKLGGNAMFWKYIDALYVMTTSNDTLDPSKLPIIAKEVGLDVAKFNECLSSGAEKARVASDLAEAIKITGGDLATPHLEIILKDKLTDEKVANIKDLFGSGLLINPDGKHISAAGAYGYDALKALIDVVLK